MPVASISGWVMAIRVRDTVAVSYRKHLVVWLEIHEGRWRHGGGGNDLMREQVCFEITLMEEQDTGFSGHRRSCVFVKRVQRWG
jgi:hypothetical protein